MVKISILTLYDNGPNATVWICGCCLYILVCLVVYNDEALAGSFTLVMMLLLSKQVVSV